MADEAEKPESDTPMTAEEHTAAALHSALDAVLADDSPGKDKAKKLAKIIRAMHADEEKAEDEAGTQEPAAAESAEPSESASGEGKTEKTEAEVKAEEDAAAKKRETEGTKEQSTTLAGELFEQAAAVHPRVDRAKGIIYRAHVLGNQSKHGYSYSLDAQKTVHQRFEGMPVGIDHDYQSNPLKVGNAFGTLRNPVVDEGGTWADLHYLTTHEQAPAILEDIERGTGIFALSSVNGRVVERAGVITSFIPGRVDVVVGGATTRTVLEQHTAPAVTKEQYDALTAKLTELEKRLILREQYVEPKAAVQQAIEKTTAGLDMSKFWNDPK